MLSTFIQYSYISLSLGPLNLTIQVYFQIQLCSSFTLSIPAQAPFIILQYMYFCSILRLN